MNTNTTYKGRVRILDKIQYTMASSTKEVNDVSSLYSSFLYKSIKNCGNIQTAFN